MRTRVCGTAYILSAILAFRESHKITTFQPHDTTNYVKEQMPMSDPISKLEIEISASAKTADKAITDLVKNLGKIKTATKDLGFANLGKEITQFKTSAEKVKDVSSKIGTVAKAFNSLKGINLTGFHKSLEALGNLSETSKKLNDVDFRQFYGQISTITRILEPLAKQMYIIGDAAKGMRTVLGKSLKIPTIKTPRAEKTDAEGDELATSGNRASSAWLNVQKVLQGVATTMRTVFTSFHVAGIVGGFISDTFKRTLNTFRRLADVAKRVVAPIIAIGKAAVKATAAIGKMVGQVGKLALGIGTTNKQAGFFSTTIGKALKSIILYRAIRSVFTQITNGFKEGTQNLARFSNAANRAMSALKTEALYLKNSLGAMAAPAIEALVPLFRILTDAIVTATNAIGMFMAVLTGKGTFVKAKRDAQDYLDGIGGSAKGAGKALKDLTGGFDELNILSDSSGGGGGGGGGGIDVSDMFEEIEIPSGIKDFANALKEAFLNQDYDWFYDLGYMLGQKFTDALGQIPWDFIQEWANATVKMVASFLNGAVDGADWSVIGYTLGQAINTVFGMMHTWYTEFNFGNLGASIAEALNEMLITTDFDLIGATIAAKINASISLLSEIFKGLNWTSVGTSVAEVINSAVLNIKFDELSSGINALGVGIFDMLYEAASKVKWGEIGERIGEFFGNIEWVNILKSATTAIGKLANGILEMLLEATKGLDGTGIAQGIIEALTSHDWRATLISAATLIGRLGNALLDAILEGVKWIRDNAADIAQAIGDALSAANWVGALKTLGEIIITALGAALKLFVNSPELVGIGLLFATVFVTKFAAGLMLEQAKLSMAIASAVGSDETTNILKTTAANIGTAFGVALGVGMVAMAQLLDLTPQATAALTALGIAIAGVSLTLKTAAGPIGWILTAIGAVVGGIWSWISASERQREEAERTKTTFIGLSDTLSSAVKRGFLPVYEAAIEVQESLAELASSGVTVTDEGVTNILLLYKKMADETIDQIYRMLDEHIRMQMEMWGIEDENVLLYDQAVKRVERWADSTIAEHERKNERLQDDVQAAAARFGLESQEYAEALARQREYFLETEDTSSQHYRNAMLEQRGYLVRKYEELQAAGMLELGEFASISDMVESELGDRYARLEGMDGAYTDRIQVEKDRQLGILRDQYGEIATMVDGFVADTTQKYEEQADAQRQVQYRQNQDLLNHVAEHGVITGDFYDKQRTDLYWNLGTQAEMYGAHSGEVRSIQDSFWTDSRVAQNIAYKDLEDDAMAHYIQSTAIAANAYQTGLDDLQQRLRDGEAMSAESYATELGNLHKSYDEQINAAQDAYREIASRAGQGQDEIQRVLDAGFVMQEHEWIQHYNNLSMENGLHYMHMADENSRMAGDVTNAISAGLTEGMGLTADTFAKEMNELFDTGWNAFKAAADINSPSGVMETEGGNLIDGLVLGIENNVANTIAAAESVLKDILGVFEKAGKEFSEIGKSIATWIADGISGNVSAITTAVKKVSSEFDKLFKEITKGTSDFSKNINKEITSMLEGVRKAVNSASQPLLNLFKTLYTNIKNESTQTSTAVANTTNTMMNTMRTNVQNATTPILNLFKTLYTEIKNEATLASTAISTTTTTMMNTMRTNIANSQTLIVNAFKQICTEITTAMTNLSTGITTATSTMVSSMATAINNNASTFTNAVKNMMNTAIGHVETAMNRMITGVNSAVGQMAKALNSLPDTNVTTSTGSSVSIPRLRIGIPRVPHDNFPAYLDRDERVLTAEENKDYSQVSNGETNALLKALIGAVEELTGRPIEVEANINIDGRRLDAELDRVRIEKGATPFPGGLAVGLV